MLERQQDLHLSWLIIHTLIFDVSGWWPIYLYEKQYARFIVGYCQPINAHRFRCIHKHGSWSSSFQDRSLAAISPAYFAAVPLCRLSRPCIDATFLKFRQFFLLTRLSTFLSLFKKFLEWYDTVIMVQSSSPTQNNRALPGQPIFTIVLASLASIVVLVRLYSRIWIKSAAGWDDMFIGGALVGVWRWLHSNLSSCCWLSPNAGVRHWMAYRPYDWDIPRR